MSEPDHYQVLGVQASSSQDEITRAFRRRARLTHPDKNPDDPEAAQRFVRVAKAYQTLSDVHLRAAYDLKVLGRRPEAFDHGMTVDDILRRDVDTVMDSAADDVLEEYIVGNEPPGDTSLMTFFRDLERTEIFILFRDAKAAYHHGDPRRAAALLAGAVWRSPLNILYRHYHALALLGQGRPGRAIREFKAALRLGECRQPRRRCPGVRRALYDLYVQRGKRLRAWWMARRDPDLLEDHMSYHDRERLRLERMAYEESLRLAGQAPPKELRG